MVIGQSAGIAAALLARDSATAPGLDRASLRRRLRQRGRDFTWATEWPQPAHMA